MEETPLGDTQLTGQQYNIPKTGQGWSGGPEDIVLPGS